MWHHDAAGWRLQQPTFAGDALDPDHAAGPWFGHRWFAYDLIRWGRPDTIVELGTHFGVSFFAFCQAVLDEQYPARLHAVDTWAGDPHAGEYGEEVIGVVHRVRDAAFPDLDVTLHRCLFSEALDAFPDDSVDLLHIDGFHTYEAVQDDFETWLPKVAPGGIVLFHDVAPESGYGSADYFAELAQRFPNLFFPHSFGLGVLAPKGTEGVEFVFGEELRRWRGYYEARAGAYLGDLVSRTQAGMIDARDEALAAQARTIDGLWEVAAARDERLHAAETAIQDERAATAAVLTSGRIRGGGLWTVAAPLAERVRGQAAAVRNGPGSNGVAGRIARVRSEAQQTLHAIRERTVERAQGVVGRSFDPLFYLVQNPDVRRVGTDPLTHYLRFGWREWRDPQPLFWGRWYCETHPDIAAARVDPFRHYLVHGWREGRDPSPLFESAWYLERSAAARDSGVSPLEHWWREGYAAGDFVHPEQQRRVLALEPADPTPARAVVGCSLSDPSGETRPVALDDLVYADVDLVTIDLWGTMVTRRRPADAAKLATARRMLLAHRGRLPAGTSPWSLLDQRVEVEAKISAASDHGEYHLVDVLTQVLVDALGLGADAARPLAESFAADEIADEVACTDPVEALVAFLDRVQTRAEPPRVAVVSDYSIGEDGLRRVLAACGFPASLPLYVSCDRGASKRLDGALFEVVRSDLGVEAGRHLHLGDNPWSDGQAQVATGGWAAVVELSASPHPGPGSLDPAHLGELVDSLRRDLRAFVPVLVPPSDDPRVVRAAQAGVLSSFMPVALVAGAIEEAVGRGVDRVLYASREGAFLARVHEVVAPALAGAAAPRAVHLEVSRRSTFGPSLAGMDRDDLLRMWRQYPNQSPRALLTSMGLDAEAFTGDVAAAGLRLDEVIEGVADDPRIDRLLGDPAFRARAGAALQQARDGLLAYLGDRLPPDGDVVLVDVGWRGTIQDNLARVLPDRHTVGLYLGLFPFLNPQPPNVEKRAVAFDANAGHDFGYADPPAVVEAPWTPDLPSVVGYRRHGAAAEPVFEAEGPRAIAAVHAFQDAVVGAAPLVAGWMVAHGVTTEMLREQTERVLREYYASPPGGVADIWFDSTHDDTFGALNDTPYAKRLPPRSILADVGVIGNPAPVTDEERDSRWGPGYRAWLPVRALEVLRQMWGEFAERG
ncbi:MAG: hypothetical protein FJW95_00400 [Actinobacteria bacterium]|nr:hypothetical protein [Actinomycetota bacterium]